MDICAEKHFQAFVCDALSVPIRSGSCDACISIAVIHHFSTAVSHPSLCSTVLLYCCAELQYYSTSKGKNKMGRNLRFAFGVSSCQSRVKLLCYCCFLDFLCLSDTLAPPEALVLMFGFHFRVLAINDTGEGGSALGVKRYFVSRLRSWADLVILGF